MDIKDSIWIEKYRPKSLDDMVLEETTRKLLDKFIREGTVPHLLLIGGVGTGKTTISKILLNSLDADFIVINASSERGIDVLRNKIKQFVMSSSFKKWKVVFLDEADGLTAEFQFALRNILESYADVARFIFTGNYRNKILDAIQSRCQVIEFQSLDKKSICKLLKTILEKEQVTYDIDELLFLIEDFFPDVRGMVNAIQLYTINNKFSYVKPETLSNLKYVLECVKLGQLSNIRKLNLDYVEAYKYLFDRIAEVTTDDSKRVSICLDIAEYLYRDGFIADKEINFAACCLKTMEQLGVKVK